jgi:hypothetical protein
VESHSRQKYSEKIVSWKKKNGAREQTRERKKQKPEKQTQKEEKRGE